MDLMSLTAVELGKKIQAKEVTVEEAVKAAIASIKAKEEKINSFVTIDEEGALKKAAEVQAKIDAGELKGALAGVPVAIKDNMCTEGLLTTCSSKILYNFIPTYTAEAVKRLEDAGCVIVGKPTWMSLPWEAPQRHLPLEQPKPMEYRARTGRFIRRKLCSSCSRGGTVCTRFRYRRINQTAKLLLWCDRNQANLRHSFTIWTHCLWLIA